jgi:hypothetical protein
VFIDCEPECSSTDRLPFTFHPSHGQVSTKWAGPLHAFLASHGYHMVTGLYGKAFNGYMGVAIAWPTKKYATLPLLRLTSL